MIKVADRTVMDGAMLADDFVVSTDRSSALLESLSSITCTQCELSAM